MPRRYRSRKREEAVQETRRKILEATMHLHGEQGILGTSWEDIARGAGVSLATVYRHFPSVRELVPACGAMAEQFMRPPAPEQAETLFRGAEGVAERVERLVAELCGFYQRGAGALLLAQREAHAVEPLAAWARKLDETRELLVRAALAPAGLPEPAVRVSVALTGFPVWRALVDAGVPEADTPRLVSGLVRNSIAEVRQ